MQEKYEEKSNFIMVRLLTMGKSGDKIYLY